MYCSIDEAWPAIDHMKNKPNTDDNYESRQPNNQTIKKRLAFAGKEHELYEEFEQFINSKKNKTVEHYNEYDMDSNIHTHSNLHSNQHNQNHSNQHNQNHNNLHSNQHNHTNNNTHNKCDDIFEHINNCEICMKRVYKQFNCIGRVNTFDFLSVFNNNENKQVMSVVLTGLLVILILQLFKNSQ